VLLGEKIEARKEENRVMGRGDKRGETLPPDLLSWPYDVNITTGRPSPPDLFPQKNQINKKYFSYISKLIYRNDFVAPFTLVAKSFFYPPSPWPSPPLGGEGTRGKDFWPTL
jgi:hypothetical protein